MSKIFAVGGFSVYVRDKNEKIKYNSFVIIKIRKFLIDF